MEDYKKMQEEWLKNHKPTICPTIDNQSQKILPTEPLIEDGFVEEILVEKESEDNEEENLEEDLDEDLEEEDDE